MNQDTSHSAERARQFDVALGHAIRRRRLMRGMTQTELAAAIGITFQQLQKYEKARNRVFFGRFVELAEALGVTPGQLLDEALARPGDGTGPQPAQGESDANELYALMRAAQGAPSDIRQRISLLLRSISEPANDET
jgi:transcriptional regulator with XRE-family HTH domain